MRAAGLNRPVIALTAHAMKEERLRCFKLDTPIFCLSQ